MLLDAENAAVAVGILLQSCIQAEINVIPYIHFRLQAFSRPMEHGLRQEIYVATDTPDELSVHELGLSVEFLRHFKPITSTASSINGLILVLTLLRLFPTYR